MLAAIHDLCDTSHREVQEVPKTLVRASARTTDEGRNPRACRLPILSETLNGSGAVRRVPRRRVERRKEFTKGRTTGGGGGGPKPRRCAPDAADRGWLAAGWLAGNGRSAALRPAP